LGYEPVNIIAHHAIKATTLVAMDKKYRTIPWGMSRKILKKVVSLDIFSGYTAPKVIG